MAHFTESKSPEASPFELSNKGEQNGWSLFRKDENPNPKVLLSVVDLLDPDKPDEWMDRYELTQVDDSDDSTDVKFFKSNSKKPDKCKPLSQLNGHN